MSQFTCFNVHTWEGGHSQYTETRYLMVIIPEVPNVISGTEIIDFFFLQKVALGPRVPTPLSLTFLDSSYFF